MVLIEFGVSKCYDRLFAHDSLQRVSRPGWGLAVVTDNWHILSNNVQNSSGGIVWIDTARVEDGLRQMLKTYLKRMHLKSKICLLYITANVIAGTKVFIRTTD